VTVANQIITINNINNISVRIMFSILFFMIIFRFIFDIVFIIIMFKA
jgi:hypothetical protein